jgi:hypothetical protein
VEDTKDRCSACHAWRVERRRKWSDEMDAEVKNISTFLEALGFACSTDNTGGRRKVSYYKNFGKGARFILEYKEEYFPEEK